ncbi:methyltransferase-like protein 27 [Tubulanus polymorphus]|uniref:methyltransferase-like protein 27 n=1 Tax=Tubulanus polymorphus TaxID=672921 RepID=UPI003DA4F891
MTAKPAPVESYLKLVAKTPSNEEVIDTYNNWTGTYDTELTPDKYRGPPTLAKTVVKYVSDKNTRILDVAAGSGLLVVELRKLGFVGLFDGLDPAVELAKKAIEKKLYEKYYHFFIKPDEPCSLADGSYDHITCCGAIIPGHIHYTGINEFLRLCKKGGYVFIAMKGGYIQPDGQFPGFDDHLKSLVDSGVCDVVERFNFENYFFTDAGVLLVLQKK